MNATHARGLLDRIEVLRHPSDVDLLVFCARHPRALMTSEQLATFLGLLSPLVELACTREGRLAIRRALTRRPMSGEEVEHDG